MLLSFFCEAKAWGQSGPFKPQQLIHAISLCASCVLCGKTNPVFPAEER